MNFKKIAYKSQDWYDAVKLREKILREPLGNKFSDIELEDEKYHIQIAGFLNNELVACAVLVQEEKAIKMQRVAVLETLRSKNYGSEMMGFCEKLAKENNVEMIYCHARNTAVNFYLKNHYEKVGEYFDEDGIPHLKMIKKL
jgi:predicted GNAT family N-acyltransferase